MFRFRSPKNELLEIANLKCSFVSYGETQDGIHFKNNDITGSKLNDDFYQVVFGDTKSLREDVTKCWKLHISVLPQDLERAWQALVPLFKQHADFLKLIKIINFKHISEKEQEGTRGATRVKEGAQITIYIPRSQERTAEIIAKYKELVKVIPKILFNLGVRPGIAPLSDGKINKYVSARHETTKRDQPYNPELPINKTGLFAQEIEGYSGKAPIQLNLNNNTAKISVKNLAKFFTKKYSETETQNTISQNKIVGTRQR